MAASGGRKRTSVRSRGDSDEGRLNLIEDLLDPGVDLRGLDMELVGQVGDGRSMVKRLRMLDMAFCSGKKYE